MATRKLTAERLTVGDSPEAIYELAEQEGWGDGLPLVPPTPERVEAMLAWTDREPGESLGKLPPRLGEATVEKVAINAVMAGCRPEYLPLVLAAVEAVAEPAFNLFGIQTTTSSATPMLIVNGPMVDEVGLNSGSCTLGPGWRSNATIGRALRLVMTNIGGGIPGLTDRAVVGQPGKYTFCLAENERASPWEPLHVERGFDRETTTVTAVPVGGCIEVMDAASSCADEVIQTFFNSINPVGGGGGGRDALFVGNPVILLASEHAKMIAREGVSKAEMKRRIWEGSRIPLDRFSTGNRNQLMTGRRARGEADLEAPLPVCRKAEDLLVVVTGGVGVKSVYATAWAGPAYAMTKPVAMNQRRSHR